MKILEELKTAQAILGRFDVPPIDMVWDDAFFSVSEREQLAAVLRRIPQLIEMIEMLEETEAKIIRISSCCDRSKSDMLRQLLSKLEEGEK